MAVEVQDVLRAHGDEFLARHNLTPQQRKAYDAMLSCRTAELGGHVDRCEGCGHELISVERQIAERARGTLNNVTL